VPSDLPVFQAGGRTDFGFMISIHLNPPIPSQMNTINRTITANRIFTHVLAMPASFSTLLLIAYPNFLSRFLA
jgi:hypothetical protein